MRDGTKDENFNKHKKGTCHENKLLHLHWLWPMPLHREQWIALLWLTMTQCAFVEVFLEDVSHVRVGEQEISCLLHLANFYPHKLWACCMLVMVETYLSKSNVEWRHENMGRYTHAHHVSLCRWQHIHVHMAIHTFCHVIQVHVCWCISTTK